MHTIFKKLFSKFEDNRKKKHNIALFSPAGDRKMLKEFISILKKQTFRDYDIFFIYPKGMDFYRDNSFQIIHAEERLPLGTSGCFFIGQAFLYNEGYEIILIADLDAIPSSEKMLEELIKEAKKSGCACLPFSKPPDSLETPCKYNVNQYGTYPREVFEKVGFTNPFFWRGAEDWDLMQRLKEKNLLKIIDKFCVYHPTAGYTIFHKMMNKKKFYPYFSSIMKAFLFRCESNFLNIVRYMLWYLFYRFFSIVFSDKEMEEAIKNSCLFKIANYENNQSYLSIEKSKLNSTFGKNIVSKLAVNICILFNLITKGKADVYTDTIRLKNEKRFDVAIGTILAFFLIPFYAMESIWCFLRWKTERQRVVYPPMPQNIQEIASKYVQYLENGKL